jgi:hypothetical protein
VVRVLEVRFEIEANQFVIRVYDDAHPDNYIASALIRVYGDRGWMSSITGPRFYEALRDRVPEICAGVGTKTLEGYVTPAHARLMRMMFKGRAGFEIAHKGQCAGREMVWVVISAL